MSKRTLSDREIIEEERGEEDQNGSRSSAGEYCNGKMSTSTSSQLMNCQQQQQQQQQQMLRCQADDCDADLGSAKRYHQRHKVCEKHSKDAVVVVGSVHQRYCQQCSRFHEISQFDDSKRSCRERLAGHNERRRKVPPDQQMEGPGSVPAVLQVKDGIHGQVPVLKDSPWKQKGPSEVIKIALPRNPPVKHFQIK